MNRYACKIALGVVCAFSVSGCRYFDPLWSGARVSPVMSRSAPMSAEDLKNCPDASATANDSAGAGGYLVRCDEDPDVEDLRAGMPRPVNLDTLKLPASDVPAYVDASKSKAGRNRLQDYLLTRSDETCIIHKSDIIAVSSTVNTSLTGLASLVGTIGSILTPESTTRALAGSAAMLTGLRDNVNQNVYYNNFADAIVKKIDEMRAQVRQEIVNKRGQEPEDYTPEAAVFDVVRYHNACSFSMGVAELSNSAKRPANAEELQGRIAALQRQFDANAAKLKDMEPGKAKDSMQRANNALARMIEALTLQLAYVQGVPVPEEAAGDTPPADASGEVGSTAKTTNGAAANGAPSKPPTAPPQS